MLIKEVHHHSGDRRMHVGSHTLVMPRVEPQEHPWLRIYAATIELALSSPNSLADRIRGGPFLPQNISVGPMETLDERFPRAQERQRGVYCLLEMAYHLAPHTILDIQAAARERWGLTPAGNHALMVLASAYPIERPVIAPGAPTGSGEHDEQVLLCVDGDGWSVQECGQNGDGVALRGVELRSADRTIVYLPSETLRYLFLERKINGEEIRARQQAMSV
ncbi:MAG TPA: hypothetical protein DDW36_04350 [Candidatus Magasanikbacteria bacterium]|nr:hypothetical protein [Candidatus Magasanikbacteria bacterium]